MNLHIPDQLILLKLEQNDPVAWEMVYDKYAAAMYGVICNLTDNTKLVEKIFKEVFIQVKEQNMLITNATSFVSTLLHHTYQYAVAQLKKHGIDQVDRPLHQTNLIYILSTRCTTLKEAATLLNISEETAKKKLYTEFLQLRGANRVSTT